MIESRYRGLDELWMNPPDALIVTGTEPAQVRALLRAVLALPGPLAGVGGHGGANDPVVLSGRPREHAAV